MLTYFIQYKRIHYYHHLPKRNVLWSYQTRGGEVKLYNILISLWKFGFIIDKKNDQLFSLEYKVYFVHFQYNVCPIPTSE